MCAQPSPGGDELRARHFLRRLGASPFGHTHETPRGTTMTAPDDDWLTDRRPPPLPRVPPEPDEEPRWWSVSKEPAEEQASRGSDPAPGVHVHITPPPTPPPVDNAAANRRARARARRWFLVHGAAASIGWTFGLYDAMTAFLNALGPGAAAAGLALAGFGWFAAEVVGERYVRVLPSRVRPPVLWALRIPMATALLATALHAPNALI